MRKHHVLLCSVISLASTAAQQPVATPVGANASATPAPAATEVASLPPVAPPAMAAPTPAVIEAPVPIAPPATQPGAATVSEPAPIPPQVAIAPNPTPVPGIPTTVVPPVVPPAPGIPTTVSAPGTTSAEAIAGLAGTHSVKDFQDEDIGPVLRLLARQASLNVVISDKVTGKITMRLENLTPLDAIKVIVTARGLTMDEQAGVYYIKTADEKAKEPTFSANYTFSYAKAEKVVPILGTQIQCGVPPQADERTNTVYYREFKSNLDNVRLFLESIDRPTQQVMIEARLVEVTANPQQSYGVNWAGTVGGASTPMTYSFGGSGLGSSTVTAGRVNPITGAPIQVEQIGTLPTVTANTVQNFSLGSNLKAIGGQFAILDVPQYTATMRFLNEDADAQFLANPRIVTANNLKATIEITRNQPVPSLNFNPQTATTVFGGFTDKNYGNTLEVTPTINKDDFVTMLVKPRISNKVSDAVFTFAGSTVSSPVIDTRSLESTVLIKSGDTLAIGGLLQDEVNKGANKVPVLGDIPFLGYAFQEHLNSRTKRNLLVFVTPTIIKQGYGTGLEDQISGLKHSGNEYADPNGWRNNAKGAVRIVPTSLRQVCGDYPKPGLPEPPVASDYKVNLPAREQ